MTAAPAPALREPVLAGSGNRAVAFVLDLTLLAFLVAGITSAVPSGLPRGIAGWGLAFFYLAAFPLTKLQGTPGKAAARIKLCTRDGLPLGPGRSLLRAAATLGWIWLAGQLAQLRPDAGWVSLVTAGWIVFFLAWASIGLTPRSQSLFDLVAGSIVVRAAASADQVAKYQPLKHSLVEVVVVVVFCGLFGIFFETSTSIAHDRNLRARIDYAVAATQPLRDKVKDFHGREGRWPSATELGVPESTPYPDGGYYRLQGDGVVQIGFTRLPDLQGRSITLRPNPIAQGIEWNCRADPRLAPRHLPAACRPG